MFETKQNKKETVTPAENIKGQWFRNTVRLGVMVTSCRQDQCSSSCTSLHLKQETAATLVSSYFSTPTLSLSLFCFHVTVIYFYFISYFFIITFVFFFLPVLIMQVCNYLWTQG